MRLHKTKLIEMKNVSVVMTRITYELTVAPTDIITATSENITFNNLATLLLKTKTIVVMDRFSFLICNSS